MISYGKIALQKVNETNKNQNNSLQNFNQKSYEFSLDSTNNYFVLTVNSNNEKVYFNLSLTSNVDCKVYINSVLQYYKHNFKFATFGLTIQNEQKVKFEFEIESSADCFVQVLGNVDIVEPNITLTPQNLNLFCVKQNETNFDYCCEDGLSQTILKFNSGQFETENGVFLDVDSNKNMLVKDNGFYKILQFEKSQIVLTMCTNNSVLLDSKSDNVCYYVAYSNNGLLNFLMLNKSGGVLSIISNISLNSNFKVNKIHKVVNNVDDSIYLICSDNNFNICVVLCKTDENDYIQSLSKPIYVGTGIFQSAIKTTSNNFIIALKNGDIVKILDININFSTSLSSVEFSRIYNNANGACTIDSNNIVLRYDNSLIGVMLSWLK